MLRKSVIVFVLAASVFVAGCHHKVVNPIANVDSKQPDKVLFDRAMDAMKHGKYSVARTLLETMINTYPDSEYVARAKLSLGDAWYAEGGTAGLQQAEVQYKDFITFFPNMPEAAEAQLKVANIHYKQMEKPDRDFTQAMRAADEYKSLIQQFPDSKLVPEAKQRLREVQEILADRQMRIARFYFLRKNLAASQARLTSLIDSYPLYSSVDEALFLLGSIYEKEADSMRGQKLFPETTRAKMSAEYDQRAIETYSKILTRYPAMLRADDARHRLQAMKAPVPTPTPEALAQNQAEEDSRKDVTRFQVIMGNFRKHPDMSRAAKAGEPTMEEEEIASAPAVVQELQNQVKAAAAPAQGIVPAQGTQKIGVEAVRSGTGAPPASQPPPGSQPNPQPAPAGATPPATQQNDQQNNELQPVVGSSTSASAGSSSASTTAAPQSATGTAQTPPARINEIGNTSEGSTPSTDSKAQNGQQDPNSDKGDSSSKKKKKKGLRKIIPF